jgi:hypothetical protein
VPDIPTNVGLDHAESHLLAQFIPPYFVDLLLEVQARSGFDPTVVGTLHVNHLGNEIDAFRHPFVSITVFEHQPDGPPADGYIAGIHEGLSAERLRCQVRDGGYSSRNGNAYSKVAVNVPQRHIKGGRGLSFAIPGEDFNEAPS